MRKRTVAIIQLLLCSAMWSMAGIFMKLIPWSSFTIAGLRSLFAGLVAFIFMKAEHMRLEISRRSVACGFILCLVFICFCAANKLTTAANAIVLQFTAPIWVMVISAAVFRKNFTKRDIIAVVIVFAGIAFFFFDRLDGGSLLGNIVALTSGMFFGTYYVCLGRTDENTRMSSIVIANFFTFLAGIPSIVITKPGFTAVPVLMIITLGVVQLGIPYVLLAKGSEYCPPLLCSLLGVLEPILNPVWVLLFDGESPGTFALTGGAVVLITITVWCASGGGGQTEND